MADVAVAYENTFERASMKQIIEHLEEKYETTGDPLAVELKTKLSEEDIKTVDPSTVDSEGFAEIPTIVLNKDGVVEKIVSSTLGHASTPVAALSSEVVMLPSNVNQQPKPEKDIGERIFNEDYFNRSTAVARGQIAEEVELIVEDTRGQITGDIRVKIAEEVLAELHKPGWSEGKLIPYMSYGWFQMMARHYKMILQSLGIPLSGPPPPDEPEKPPGSKEPEKPPESAVGAKAGDCDGSTVSLYVAAHGQYANVPSGTHVETIGDYVEKFYKSHGFGGVNLTRKMTAFAKFLDCLKCTSASGFGFTATMEPLGYVLTDIKGADGKRIKLLVKSASELTNMQIIAACLEEGLPFDMIRIMLRLFCADGRAGDKLFLDATGYNRNVSEVYSSKAGDSFKTIKAGKNFWKRLLIALETMNKQFFLNPNLKESVAFFASYGIHIMPDKNSAIPAVPDAPSPNVHAAFRAPPLNAEAQIAANIRRYMSDNGILETPLITELINKIYFHSTTPNKSADDFTCTLADVLLLFFELGIKQLNVYDASCSVVMRKQGKQHYQVALDKFQQHFPDAVPAQSQSTQDVLGVPLQDLIKNAFVEIYLGDFVARSDSFDSQSRDDAPLYLGDIGADEATAIMGENASELGENASELGDAGEITSDAERDASELGEDASELGEDASDAGENSDSDSDDSVVIKIGKRTDKPEHHDENSKKTRGGARKKTSKRDKTRKKTSKKSTKRDKTSKKSTKHVKHKKTRKKSTKRVKHKKTLRRRKTKKRKRNNLRKTKRRQ